MSLDIDVVMGSRGLAGPPPGVKFMPGAGDDAVHGGGVGAECRPGIRCRALIAGAR